MTGDGMIRERLTPESINMMRARIGYPNPSLRRGYLPKPKNTLTSADGIRQWVEGIGDANPLYNDAAYAANTRWEGSIAPPGYEMTTGQFRNRVMPAAEAEATRKALRGVQLFYSGAEQTFYRPIRVGDEIYKSTWVDEVQEKASEFAGKSVVVTNATAFWNQRDETVANSKIWFIHAERRPAGSIKKNEVDVAPQYTDEDLDEIEAAYDAEQVRGADTLYYEDIEVGHRFPRMVKGPLTVTDMFCYWMGMGWGSYGNPPHRLAYENRKLLRGFYSRNEFNAWDTIQRVHWDPGAVESIGVRRLYDAGSMRYAYLCHYITSSIGDDAWLYRVRYELRKFNYTGDITWLNAEVTAKRVDDVLGPLVEIAIKGVNQRGQENITATATILLASRDRGPVELPPIPPMTPYRS